MNEFNNLPTPMKIGAGSLGVITIGGATFLLPRGALLWFFGVLLVLLVLFLIGWLVWRSMVRRQRNARISGGLADDGRATPKGISDPAKRAKLEDLRKKFLTGVNEYRSRGKDLYKLPWYVICGPPGAGKTEAIRRCNVGFPPGMQDGLQGVGGTINMNWWFTNHAVILDTAGKLMFEEVSPGETSEWKEFLTLLKKSRPNCPINGLFLAISVEDLIKDSSEKILQKAGKIAQQLDVIQRVLDVRFPVYVIVTKCDLLTGFREFFDDITDPQLQHQMVGWSNPEQLDTPFRPELIDQHLKSVSQRLRQRRLGLLRDPVPESSDRRRTDEVDAMFALPHSLTGIGPRLRRYLETIFVAGEWSAKPLFLRGIYFTSSMREGSALDEELAAAIGVPVGELPAGRGWERERSYFLRDLFMEKVFKEHGLVTRATNTGRMLRQRRLVMYGTGFAFLALFGFFCFWGKARFDRAIGQQSAYWAAATQARPIVSVVDGTIVDHSGAKVVLTNYGEHTLAGFQHELRKLATNKIDYGIFSLFAREKKGDTGLEDRLNAQAAVFERDVVRPLVTQARVKMAGSTSSSPEETEALKALLQMQARHSISSSAAFLEKDTESFITSLMSYVTGGKINVDTNLAHTMSWLYSDGARARGWPPVWLAVTNAEGTNLLVRAFGRLLNDTKEAVKSNKVGQETLTALDKAHNSFNTREADLIKEINDPARSWKKINLASYTEALQAWQGALNTARSSNALGQFTTASAAFAEVVQKGQTAGENSMKRAEEIIKVARGELAGILTTNLAKEKSNLLNQLASSSKELGGQLVKIDDRSLATNSSGLPHFRARENIYRLLAEISPPTNAWVGDGFANFGTWQKEAASLQQKIAGAGVDAELTRAASNYVESTTRFVADKMLAAYAEDMSNKVMAGLAFPILRPEQTAPGAAMTSDQVRNKVALLDKIQSDLQAAALTSALTFRPGVPVTRWQGTLRQLRSVAAALAGDGVTAPACQISLPFRAQDKLWREPVDKATFNSSSVNFVDQEYDLGSFPLTRELDFKFYKFGQVIEEYSLRFGDWGPVHMLLEPSHQVSQGVDGQMFEVTRQLRDVADAKDQTMLFKLHFKQPLPKPNDWPARETVQRNLSLQP